MKRPDVVVKPNDMYLHLDKPWATPVSWASRRGHLETYQILAPDLPGFQNLASLKT